MTVISETGKQVSYMLLSLKASMQLTVVGNLKLAIGTGTLGVDNALWDALTVEVG